MKHTALSIALTYVPAEDRIRLSGRCEDGTCVAVWVTRRHLAILLPRLAEWLDRQSPLQRKVAVPVAARREVGQFEHQAAQAQVKAERRRERPWSADVEFLLDNFGANLLGKGSFVVHLVAPAGARQLSLPMTAPQLHKFVRELLEIGRVADWGVADPWQKSPEAAASAADGTRH